MNPSTLPTPPGLLRFGLATLVCCLSLGATAPGQSSFDQDLDGWSLLNAPTAGTNLEWRPAGGDPGGFAQVEAMVNLAGVVTTLADSGSNSLRGLVGNASVSRITFAPALSGKTIFLGGSAITINRNVTIDASALPEGITISGNSNGDGIHDPGESRIFVINAGRTVTLRGLRIVDGQTQPNDPLGPQGGAIKILGTLILEDCVVSGSSATEGGGLHVMDPGSATIQRSRITGNRASFFGGGVISNGSLTVFDSTISGNIADLAAGGVLNEGTATLHRTTISGNHAETGGGGIGNSNTLSLIQSTVSGNTTALDGGAIYNTDLLYLTHTTVSNNSAEREGGGIFIQDGSVTLTHSIVAGNDAPTDANIGNSGELTTTLSLTSGDPLLAPLGDYGGPTETMPPLAGSPAIDGAIVLATPIAADQRGFPRGPHGLPDIGAVEFGDVRVYHFVDARATGANDGTSWGDAFTALSAALDAATPGDEIWVAAGFYTPGDDRSDTFQLKPQVAVYGGFSGSETDRSQRNRDPATNGTVLSGDIGVPGDFSDNVYHVVNATGANAATVLSGFTITGGNADAPGTDMPARGAGLISITSGSPTLEDLRFVGNRAAYVGGAVYLNASSPTFSRVLFADNATTAGRGTAVDGFGGAIYANASAPVFIDCRFVGNHSATSGGALHLQTTNATFTNCLFSHNTADGNAGAVHVVNSSPTFINATVSANVAGLFTGGILHNGTGTTTLTNSIVWANTDSDPGDPMRPNLAAAAPALQFSLAQGRNPGGSNLDGTLPANAPAFIAPALGDFRLGAASPARNAGNNAANPRLNDVAGQRRIQAGTIDLGAYEGARDVIIEIDAPAHFLGDQLSFLGGRLRLSSRLTSHLQSTPDSGGEILLTGAGITLRHELADLTPEGWRSDSVRLDTAGPWFLGTGSELASANTVAAVLKNITSLRIRFPLRAGLEARSLDSIAFSPEPEAAAHFRFGDNPASPGIFLQSLTGAPLSAAGVSAYTLPAVGPGSAFPNPVTQPGLLNTQAADFGVAAAYDSTRVVSAVEVPSISFGPAITVEAFIHATSLGSTDERIIAAHGFDDGVGLSQPSWSFGVGPAGTLVFRANASGSPGSDAVFTAPFTVETGRDYYVGVSFEGGTVTFFQQDFTAGSDLIAVPAVQLDNGVAAPTILFDPVAPLRVGNSPAGDRAWHGLIDEVRIQDFALDMIDLLVAPFDISGGVLVSQFIPGGAILDLSTLKGGTATFDNVLLSFNLPSSNNGQFHNLDLPPFSRVHYRLDSPGIIGSGVNDLIRYPNSFSVSLNGRIGYFDVDINPGANFGPGTYRLIEREPGVTSNLQYYWSFARLGDVPDGYSYELSRDSIGNQKLMFTNLDVIVRPARTLTGPILAASDADIGEAGLDLGFKGGSLRLTESFTSSERRLFIHKGHDALIEVDDGKTVDWNGTTLNFGRLIKTGGGTLNLADGISHYGQLHLNGGWVSGSFNNTIPGHYFFFDGGGYRFDSDYTFGQPIHFGPEGGTLDVASGVTVSIPAETGTTGTGPITKTGSGILRYTVPEDMPHRLTVDSGQMDLLLSGSRTLPGLSGEGGVVRVLTSFTDPRRVLNLTDTLAFEGVLDLGNANLRVQSGDKLPMTGSGTIIGLDGHTNIHNIDSSADFTYGKSYSGGGEFVIQKFGSGTMTFASGLNFPVYGGFLGNYVALQVQAYEGTTIIPPGFHALRYATFPGSESLIGTDRIHTFHGSGGVVRLGPGFITLYISSGSDSATSSTRFVMKLRQPGVFGEGVNDMIRRWNWRETFLPVFDIEAHPGFGPGRYRLIYNSRGFHPLSPLPTIGETPEGVNYSYHLEVFEGVSDDPGLTIIVGIGVDLIVTANPESYTEWMEQRFFAAGTVPAPWDESPANGLGSNALAYFFGLNPLAGEIPETMSFRGFETITPEVGEGEEPAEPVTYARVRFRKNHHFGDANFAWVLQSSQTLAEGSWASHPDLALEWISLTEDGEATVWEALVPLEADQPAGFFRIALEVEEEPAP
ncbi:MAG: hypothetical protein JJT96_13990 [Opitutales bacterium]|nr:hypothetical protein [Opitutales bacterium]